MDDIKNKYLSELSEELKELGEPQFRAKQVFKWLHEKNVKSIDEMISPSHSGKSSRKSTNFALLTWSEYRRVR